MAEPAAALHTVEDDTIIPGHPHAADRRVKPKDPRCVDCRFWERLGEPEDQGLCRINPPTIWQGQDAWGQPKLGAYWPPTEEHDWCSYHQPERRR